MNYAKALICCASLMFCAIIPTFAQDEEEKDRGTVSAGYETNTTFYFNDKKNGEAGAVAPEGKFGSNNYVKVDYIKGAFSAGIQLEGYLPAIQGLFPQNLDNKMLMRKDFYVSFKDKGWDIRVGSLYEQFGSGLLLRTYEDRTLGINNALQGFRVAYTFGDYLTVKALYGRIRNLPFDVEQTFTDYSKATAAGADISFSLSRVLETDRFDLAIEGSVLDKYEPDPMIGGPHATGYSGRISFGIDGFTLKGEYMNRKSDPAPYNNLDSTRNEAILVEMGYSGYGFGGLLTFRKVSNPFLQGFRMEPQTNYYTFINYVPALTQQHTYMLASLNPYSTQPDEIGGQADLYYNFKRGTVLGGRKGMKVHVNYSNFYGRKIDINTGALKKNNQLLYRDLTVDIERWFGKDFKMILFYSWQTVNATAVGHGDELWTSHIAVADLTYKFNRKYSLRMELQHLFTEQDQKNWAAALLEFNVAPRWSVSVQDMWNYGDTKTHYFSGSVSYSYSKIRAALNFGRFKEGYLCSGGVCRVTPAYTGINLALTVNL